MKFDEKDLAAVSELLEGDPTGSAAARLRRKLSERERPVPRSLAEIDVNEVDLDCDLPEGVNRVIVLFDMRMPDRVSCRGPMANAFLWDGVLSAAKREGEMLRAYVTAQARNEIAVARESDLRHLKGR